MAAWGKMAFSAGSMKYDEGKNAVTNPKGSILLDRVEKLLDQVEEMKGTNIKLLDQVKEMKGTNTNLLDQVKELKEKQQGFSLIRANLLDIRQRNILTWIRDTHGKDGKNNEEWRQEVCMLNRHVVHAGNVMLDAVLVTERFKPTSLERTKFPDLYGLSADTVNELGILYRFP
jgi:predicted RNase H-like nuclease (RuvC/YqgF family)